MYGLTETKTTTPKPKQQKTTGHGELQPPVALLPPAHGAGGRRADHALGRARGGVHVLLPPAVPVPQQVLHPGAQHKKASFSLIVLDIG